MTAATCGSVSAPALGLPDAIAVPAAKGTLPKAAFVGKGPISSGLKARLINDIAAIALLGLIRPANAGVDDGARVHEVLVLGLRLAKPDAPVPADVIEHIAELRRGGILFVCVRDGHDGDADTLSEQCVLAVRRRIPGRAGHVAQYAVHAGAWQDPADMLVEIAGSTMDDVWDSLCSQAILGTTDHADLDARIARRDRIAELEAAQVRLAGDHKRAKDPAKRNEAFAKLAKVRAELAQLRG